MNHWAWAWGKAKGGVSAASRDDKKVWGSGRAMVKVVGAVVGAVMGAMAEAVVVEVEVAERTAGVGEEVWLSELEALLFGLVRAEPVVEWADLGHRHLGKVESEVCHRAVVPVAVAEEALVAAAAAAVVVVVVGVMVRLLGVVRVLAGRGRRRARPPSAVCANRMTPPGSRGEPQCVRRVMRRAEPCRAGTC